MKKILIFGLVLIVIMCALFLHEYTINFKKLLCKKDNSSYIENSEIIVERDYPYIYDIEKDRIVEPFEEYCSFLMEIDIDSAKKDDNLSEKMQKDLDLCLNILNQTDRYNYTNTTMISLAGYYARKSEIIYNKYVNDVVKTFASDKDFILKFKEKLKNLNAQNDKILDKEFPYPDEGRETHIYLYSRVAELKYNQLEILKGFVTEYCIEKNNENCKKFLYERNGEKLH